MQMLDTLHSFNEESYTRNWCFPPAIAGKDKKEAKFQTPNLISLIFLLESIRVVWIAWNLAVFLTCLIDFGDLLDGDKGECVKTGESCEFLLYQKKIEDPDQMAARISGLEINTTYKLKISALTAVGAGKPRELKVHTAKQRPRELGLQKFYCFNFGNLFCYSNFKVLWPKIIEQERNQKNAFGIDLIK